MAWLEVRNAASDSASPVELLIYEQIGKDFWSDSGVQAKQFAEALAEIPMSRDIVVAINSPGGSVWDGLAIYHQLQARKDRVTCRVDGVAASIASVIAMAGKRTEMPDNALLMIHNPFGFAMGDAETMRKTADDLDKHKQVLVNIYVAKTGKSAEEVSKMMDDETWMSGKEALEHRFADAITGASAVLNSHDLSRFRRVPAAVTGGVVPPPTGTNKKENIPMDETKTTPKAEATPAPVATIDPAEFAAVKNQLKQERDKRISNQLHTLAASRDIDPKAWLPRVVADESLIEVLAALPERGTTPVRQPIEVSDTEASDPKNEKEAGESLLKISDPKARSLFYARNKAKCDAAVFNSSRIFTSPQAANSFTTLTDTVLSQKALEAFTKTLLPIRAFTTDFSAEAVNPCDTVKVTYISGASAAVAFTGSYTIQDSTAEGLDISIDQRPYVSWGLTPAETMTMPTINMERFANQKGNALGLKVLQDIFSLITEANYGNDAISSVSSGGDQLTVAAANLDLDEISWLFAACGLDDWPEMPRSLVLSIPYYTALFRESEIVGADGAKDAMLQQAVIRSLMGFDIYPTNAISATATDNVTGFAATPDGILIAGRTIMPPAGMSGSPATRVLTEPATGLSIVQRDWFDPDNDQSKRVLECAYGKRKGLTTGVKLISSS